MRDAAVHARRPRKNRKENARTCRTGFAERAQYLPKPEALEFYKKSNQMFKCELVEEKVTEPTVSFYTTGKFIDFAAAPHIPSTKRIQAFKL